MKPPLLGQSRSTSVQGARLVRASRMSTPAKAVGGSALPQPRSPLTNSPRNSVSTTPGNRVRATTPSRSRSSTPAAPTPPRSSVSSNTTTPLRTPASVGAASTTTPVRSPAVPAKPKAPTPQKGAPPAPKVKAPKPLPCKPLPAPESKAMRESKDMTLFDAVVAGWPTDFSYARGAYLVQDWQISQRPAYLNDEFLLYHDGHSWRVRDTTTYTTLAATPSKSVLPYDADDTNRQWSVASRPHPKLTIYPDHIAPYPAHAARSWAILQAERSRANESQKVPDEVGEVVVDGIKKGTSGADLMGVYAPVAMFNGRPAYRRADMWLLFDGLFWMIRSGGIDQPSAVAGRMRAFVFDKAELPTMIATAWTVLKIEVGTLYDSPPLIRIDPMMGVDVKEADWAWVDVVMSDAGRMKSKEDNEMLGVYTTLTPATLPLALPCPLSCQHPHTLPNTPRNSSDAAGPDHAQVNHRPILQRGAFFLLYDPFVGWCIRSGYDCVFALIADASRPMLPSPPGAPAPSLSAKARRSTKAFVRSDAIHPTDINPNGWAVGEHSRSLAIAPLRASDSELFLKQDAEEKGSMVVGRRPGSAGVSAVERDLEGTYHRVKGERLNGRNVYWTREPQDMWMVFDGARWAVGDRRDGGGLKRMVLRSDASVPSQAKGAWTVHTDSGYQAAPSLSVTAVEPTGPSALMIKGPSVLEEAAGIYQPLLGPSATVALHNGRPVFTRPAPSSHTQPLILLFENNSWTVFSGATKPGDVVDSLAAGDQKRVRRRLYIVSGAENPVEVQGEWVVLGDDETLSQRTALVTVSEATREDHIKDAVSRKMREEEERSDVVVSGGQGDAMGLYRKQRNPFDDRPVYRRQAYWLYHDLDSWVIRSGLPMPQTSRGTTHYMTPSPSRLPSRCSAAQWLVLENAKFVPAPAVQITTATVLDVEAEVAREAKRRAEVTRDIRISGLESDEELQDAMGVYSRNGKGMGRGVYVKGDYELSFEGSKWSLLHSEFRSPIMYAVDSAIAPCHVTEKWRVRDDNRFRVSDEVLVQAVDDEPEEANEPDTKVVAAPSRGRAKRQTRGPRI
eukprot:c13362_g1_i1.p1 GENE.c13362_g1_i1~~c13362_g1_i1.p1  ORF type:complete len:1079 (+),score=181.00 c13362_g1_i1:28-3237(+)